MDCSRAEPSRVSQTPDQDRNGQTTAYAPAFVSVVNEFPEDLYDAMREFVRTHPQWDQYRLMQASLAGFLFQHGSTDRAVSRHYLNGLFHREGSQPLQGTPQQPSATKANLQAKPAPNRLVNLTPGQRLPQGHSWSAAA